MKILLNKSKWTPDGELPLSEPVLVDYDKIIRAERYTKRNGKELTIIVLKGDDYKVWVIETPEQIYEIAQAQFAKEKKCATGH